MLRLWNLRRAAGLSAVALTVAGAAGLTSAGTARADESCATSPAGWEAWTITACVGLVPGYKTAYAYTEADALPHATDVRIYTQLWRSCDGNRTWQMVDSTASRGGTHAGPTDEGKGTWYDGTNTTPRGWCSFQAHGWLDESGVTRANSWAVVWGWSG